MHAGESHAGRADPAGARGTVSPPRQVPPPAGRDSSVRRPAALRWWPAAAWIGCGIALFAFLLRISLSFGMNSDGANNALQGWDMLHGHLLLRGWIIGDATYYTLELPLYAVTEALLGLSPLTCHVVSALTYLIVVACAAALAMADSKGPSRAARCAAVIAVLASPLLTRTGVQILLGVPDHAGTSAIMMVSFLLVDRAPGRRFTPPLLCAILCAGQIGDTTVRYVAVPAILLVCAYRIVAVRKVRTTDAAILLAAAASLPLARLIRAAMKHFGAFAMVPPSTRKSPAGLWPHNVVVALTNIRTMFGVVPGPHAVLGVAGAAFGLICLLAALYGFGRVIWTWRTASRSEQLLCVAIVVFIAVYVVSTLPKLYATFEIISILPFGAVLAARACLPARIGGAWRGRVTLAAAALAALLPLAAAATPAPVTPTAVPVAAWLEAHGLTYGIAGYWDASAVAVQSADRVQVRAVQSADRVQFRAVVQPNGKITPYAWETKPSWYDPSLHDATFVIGYPSGAGGNITLAMAERNFGRPAAVYQVAGRVIMVYKTNLLKEIPQIRALPTG
ncbi:MAG TPA: hypothetical protein VED20_07085 [Streptosporangiaceae bacterium]|nr:hypothetical protein [Streptosporangiaceae bacterium]